MSPSAYIGSLDLPRYNVKDLGVCWNDSFPKMFGCNRWEPVTELQFFCHKMPFECIYDLCEWNFLYNSSHISTVVLFIDMHGVIDVFNSKYGKAGESNLCRKNLVWQISLQGTSIIKVFLFDFIHTVSILSLCWLLSSTLSSSLSIRDCTHYHTHTHVF